MDAAAAAPEVYAPARLAQLQQDLESATRSQPTTLVAARLCLDRLATSAAAVVAGVEALDADPESQLRWWAHAFAGQCRDALDELTFLAPWTELLSSPNRPRRLSRSRRDPNAARTGSTGGEAPAGDRASAQLCRHAGGKRLAW